MTERTEKLNAKAAQDAAISKGAGLAEALSIKGRYLAECYGPREELREEYVGLQIDAFIAEQEGRTEVADEIRVRMAGMTEIKWRDTIENLVVTVGKNDMLDKYFAGSSYTAAFYVGLVDGASSPTYNAADIMSSHAGWTENQAYSNANRLTAVWAAAAAGAKALSAALGFNINGAATIAGAFMTTVNTKGGTTGILWSGGSFTGGNKTVASGDTLNVSWTGSL
jgi:hypothetical protein